MTFLRQSNFLLTPTAPGNLITRGSVRPAPYGLAVHVASTKTLLGNRPVVLPVHRAPNSRYCPVACYLAARAATPAPASGPLFINTQGRPLTAQGVCALMRAALRNHGHPAANYVTVHSLRRSGACCAAQAGEGPSHLTTHGTWRARSIDIYVPRTLYTSVPQTMSALLVTSTSVQTA